ncbi:sodium ion-translocating decarboxylase subunit beta [Treponema sp.]|uniref:sodium ion-translocating decarboxylase subunit beta n=1 Tax=Treponema sp. TaxID=166 RepID=UPI0025F77DB1|nr:sodium ion-translocating decarboxylase subunit beta [Treponema sp.]MCR5219098.1 sodium ion-translocating decarboxylase subunit beta [Treponema sp.]
MPFSKTENNKKIAFIMIAIMAVAGIMGIMKTALTKDVISSDSNLVLAQSDEVKTDAAAEKDNTGMDRVIPGTENWNGKHDIRPASFLKNLWETTGIYQMIHSKGQTAAAEEAVEVEKEDPFAGKKAPGYQYLIMIAIGFLIIYLGAGRGFEPLLLIPIGFGTVLVNIPGANMGLPPDGMLSIIYNAGVGNEFFPMLIFMGIGAMTDFGPLIANPKMALLGGAAQFGVFFTLFGVSLLNLIPGVFDYNILQASAIAIIGGADGPTSIYVSAKLAPELMAVIAVAAYSYMALVPMIQPPIMKALTTKKERMIHMDQLRPVSKAEKVLFPMMLIVLTMLLLPSAAPLIGMLAFGNFVKQCGVVERLSKTMENEMMNIVSILLSLGVGSQMTPEKIINGKSFGIIILGLVAFCVASATGVLMAKLMNVFLPKGKKINPLIGSAGVSAVPMAARVSNKVGLEYDPSNFLLMNAMGPNVSGVIGTAIAAGVFIATFAK